MQAFSFARRCDLLVLLATKDFKTRYLSAKLGAFYAFGVALAMMTVLAAAFGRIFKQEVAAPYPLFVFSALIPWNFLSFSLNQSADSFRVNASIVRKVPFPRELVPLGLVAAHALTLFLSFVAFVPIALFFGVRPSPLWLFFPVAALTLAAFVAGLAMIVSTAGVFFIETKPAVEVTVLLWFYCTPVFYPTSIVPERFAGIVRWNPMTHLLELFRSPLVMGHLPTPGSIVYALAAALTVLAAGWFLVKRYEGVIPDRVG